MEIKVGDRVVFKVKPNYIGTVIEVLQGDNSPCKVGLDKSDVHGCNQIWATHTDIFKIESLTKKKSKSK